MDLSEGRVYQKGTEAPAVELAKLVSLARHSAKPGPEIEETAYFHENRMTHSYGVHLAHVAVEPETGFIDILKYMVVEDVGRCINPLLVHGQTVCAAAQGIGGTLLEELVYGEDGQLLTTTFRDYVLPSSTDVPPIESVILEEAPSPLNPLGVKGAGAALTNAVANALRVEIKELPLSPERVRRLIRSRQAPPTSAGDF